MDLISNLIKRPISLVLNETADSMDKYSSESSLATATAVAASAITTPPSSLPSNLMVNSKVRKSLSEDREIENHGDCNNKNNAKTAILNMSSSCHAGNGDGCGGDNNITDFIGVPERYLEEFEDILPPPPLSLQSNSLLHIEITRSISVTPPPPPSPPLTLAEQQLQEEIEKSHLILTPSMKASQTIDELLSHINDNLQQAGLNDDVLAIASPPNKLELNPLTAAKAAALNNSKQTTASVTQMPVNTAKLTPTTAAITVFENNSSLHKFDIDPELETGLFNSHNHHHHHHQQEQQQQSVGQQQSHVTTKVADHLNAITSVNKLSNKFVGLTEFDESKIPELPGDLNSNIEEQYSVTFEECLIPTLTTQQEIKDPNEFVADRTHFLLPTDIDTISSDNETYADCNDGKDPLATTFSEIDNLDATTDLESYRSAVNIAMNDTMENIVDLTTEPEPQILQAANETQVVEELKTENKQQPFEQMQEDEPMDVDMNSTLQITQNTSDNIRHIEEVIQQAENLLQQQQDTTAMKSIEDLRQENSFNELNGIIAHSADNTGNLELKEQPKHELVVNKSVEIKHLSSEDIIEKLENESNELQISKVEVTSNVSASHDKLDSSASSNLSTKSTDDIEKTKNENNQLPATKAQAVSSLNVTVDSSNSSTKSVADSSKAEMKLNLTLNLNCSSTSQKSSAPNSPSFPIKHAQAEGFPRSPKALLNKLPQSPFLEKANYVDNFKTQNAEEKPLTNLNSKFAGPYVESNANENSLEINNPSDKKRLTSGIDSLMPQSFNQEKEKELEIFPSQDKRRTFSVEEKRRTFTLDQSQEEPAAQIQFPAAEEHKPTADTVKISVNNGTSSIHEESVSEKVKKHNSRRTFNVSTDQTTMNTSCEPMDVDDIVEAVAAADKEIQSLPSVIPAKQESSQPIENLTTMQQRSQSPPVPAVQQKFQPTSLPFAQPKSQPPPVPALQQRNHNAHEIVPRSKSPPLSQSPPVPALQPKIHNVAEILPRPKSPPVPALQQKIHNVAEILPRSKSPPLPTLQQRSQSPPSPTARQQEKTNIQPVQQSSLQQKQKIINIKQEQISPTLENNATSSEFNPRSLSLPTLIQKRPPIRDIRSNADVLSAKEQNNIKVKDEKDIFVEKSTPSPIEEDVFATVTATSTTLSNTTDHSEFDETSSSSSSSIMNKNLEQQPSEQPEQFEENFSNIILNPSDFDYLLTKGNNDTQSISRSSLLLKFDPFLGVPVPTNQGPQQQLQQLQIPTNTIIPCLSPTLEEDEHNESNPSFVTAAKTTKDSVGSSGIAIDAGRGSGGGGDGCVASKLTEETSAKLLLKRRSQEVKQQLNQFGPQSAQENKNFLKQGVYKKNATMSVDVIKDMSLDNDCNKAFENSNSTQSDDKQINYKMDELEKKIKNEVLKTEDIEKKLKDAEQREEALIKRITEKDKTISKMNGVIEAYEKAIAELIAEKEQLIQNYEKQLAEVKADRDSNYHHLTSLETTFSDLHVKYEKSKEMTCQLKASEEALQAEKRKNLENLHLQEQRYDKMKNHAMQQLEIANKKLESLTRDHSVEVTKLKALLKKEEIARSSINEQLTQKTRENAELVKICDELIANQGS